MNNDWIPCSERTPPIGVQVLAYGPGKGQAIGGANMDICIWDGSEWLEEGGTETEWGDSGWTHWMPLPEKPSDAVSQADAIPTLPTLPEILGSMTPEQREKARSDILEKFDHMLSRNPLLDDLKFVEVDNHQ